MAKAYQYTADGYYAEEIEDYGLLPNNATYVAPEFLVGHVPHWTGTAWEQVEDHKGKQGYVLGQPKTITEYGPLPQNWSDTPPPPAPEELAKQRIAEIKAELVRLDISKVRPLEAMADGSAGEEERTVLAELKVRTDALREEMHILEMGI